VWYKAPTMLPAGDQDEVELVITSSVERIEIINKIINVASSWLFILLYQ
jgi:hypothetical protein